MATLTSQELKLLASLRSDPAHLLLVDYLYKVADDLTDELEDPALTDVELLPKLRHWQAFRRILSIIRNQPEAWAEEFKEYDVPEVTPSADPAYLALQQKVLAQQRKLMETDFS